MQRRRQSPRVQQQQQQPSPADLIIGGSSRRENPIAAAAAVAASVQNVLQQRRPTVLLQNNGDVITWKASIWTWLGPLLALVYILSPLDAIPDFLPLVGWIDDILVAGYLVTTVLGRLAQARR